MRLRALVHFQKLISVCLPLTVSYCPPKYYFKQSKGKLVATADKPIK